jgi:hypothetical protein
MRRESDRERYEQAREAARAEEGERKELHKALINGTLSLRAARFAMDRPAFLHDLEDVFKFEEQVTRALTAGAELAIRLPAEHPALREFDAALDALQLALNDLFRPAANTGEATEMGLGQYRDRIDSAEAGFRAASRSVFTSSRH